MSMTKIEEVLASKGFVIRRYFTLDDFCIYLEVFSVKDASRFMLYVTGRYELKIPPGIRENVFPLKYMEVDNIDTAEYAEEPDKVDMEEFYNHFNINFDNKTSYSTQYCLIFIIDWYSVIPRSLLVLSARSEQSYHGSRFRRGRIGNQWPRANHHPHSHSSHLHVCNWQCEYAARVG